MRKKYKLCASPECDSSPEQTDALPAQQKYRIIVAWIKCQLSNV